MVALCDVSVGILWKFIDSDCNQSQKVFTQENPDSKIKAVFIYAPHTLFFFFFFLEIIALKNGIPEKNLTEFLAKKYPRKTHT